mgnify:FL=1
MATPNPEVIKYINRHHQMGDKILLLTARGSVTGRDWRSLTEAQLLRWGVRYDELHFGKPAADMYVDDRAMNISDWIEKERTNDLLG